jgi:hypothetical protein
MGQRALLTYGVYVFYNSTNLLKYLAVTVLTDQGTGESPAPPPASVELQFLVPLHPEVQKNAPHQAPHWHFLPI